MRATNSGRCSTLQAAVVLAIGAAVAFFGQWPAWATLWLAGGCVAMCAAAAVISLRHMLCGQARLAPGRRINAGG
ncbi:MAG: hypothetical protein L6Q69_22400 [Zoogloea sp.]|nr:hypothetical protein [Zoogloea sp.]